MKTLNLKLAIYACTALTVIGISAFSYAGSKNTTASEETVASLNDAMKSELACPQRELIEGEECNIYVEKYDEITDTYYWELEHFINLVCEDSSFPTRCFSGDEYRPCDGK